MRVLFSSLSGIGHINPMVPLARALQEAGHEVHWATGPESCARVQAAGIDVTPAGLSQSAAMAEFWRRHPATRDLPPQQWPDHMFPKTFGGISAPAALPDLLELARSWRPAVVVHDAAELAAPIAAAAIGVPHVTHAFGALLPASRVQLGAEAVAPLWESEGLESRPYAGCYDHLYIDIYPPSLQPPGGEHVGRRQHLRPVAFDGATDDVGGEIAERLGRPLVYLTFGTFFQDNPAFRAALAGISDLGVGLVVTVGPKGDPAAFGEQPSHVVVERYIPQSQLLGACDVVASHAGSGTALATLAHAIPQLCLPQAADQFLNAAAIGRSGAGIAIAPAEVDSAGVATAVRRLLDDPEPRDSARRVADEIAAMPSPEDVAGVIETLV